MYATWPADLMETEIKHDGQTCLILIILNVVLCSLYPSNTPLIPMVS